MWIALPTSLDLPDWEVDDRPLYDALEGLGCRWSAPVWDDPSVDWSVFDACLIRTTWNYMDRRAAYIQWAEHVDTVSRLFNPPEAVRWNTDKRYLQDLAAHGVPVIPSIWLERNTDVQLEQVLSGQDWTQGLLKPRIGATARETLRFGCDRAGIRTASAHLERLLRSEDMILQPYLERVEREGELSVVFLDDGFSHAVRKTPAPGDYRVQEDFGGRDQRMEIGQETLGLAEKIFRLVEQPGELWGKSGNDRPLLYARIDLLRDGDEQLVLNELEIVEPSLFFRHCSLAPQRLAEGLLRRVAAERTTSCA